MARTYESVMDALRAAGSGNTALQFITIQDDGIVSYGSGILNYVPSPVPSRPDKLVTTPGRPIDYYFSNRPGSITIEGTVVAQPFPAGARDRVDLTIGRAPTDFGPGALTARFTLLSWDNAQFSVEVEAKDSYLVGTGPSIPSGQPDPSRTAFYVFAFPPAPRL
jgi:hypothetical protein